MVIHEQAGEYTSYSSQRHLTVSRRLDHRRPMTDFAVGGPPFPNIHRETLPACKTQMLITASYSNYGDKPPTARGNVNRSPTLRPEPAIGKLRGGVLNGNVDSAVK